MTRGDTVKLKILILININLFGVYNFVGDYNSGAWSTFYYSVDTLICLIFSLYFYKSLYNKSLAPFIFSVSLFKSIQLFLNLWDLSQIHFNPSIYRFIDRYFLMAISLYLTIALCKKNKI